MVRATLQTDGWRPEGDNKRTVPENSSLQECKRFYARIRSLNPAECNYNANTKKLV